ncbi:MAG TPA: hypothetical protein VFN02_04195 [Ktedonobacteraceae bacterium]|nr:hypothetical protein [Ktedonobacteraceae bacterium]
MSHQDVLLRYCIALDAGDFDALGEVLEQASAEPGLDQAIAGIHQRFDSNESFTEQLQRQRYAYNSEPRGDGGGPEQ